MSDELVTVYTAMDETDAEVIRLVLDAEGISAFVENANQGGLAGCLPAHVQVRAEDAERAANFIAEHEANTVMDDEDDDEDGDDQA